MKLFFSENIEKDIIHLENDEAIHCLKTNRKKKHDTIKVIDGKGNLYEGKIINDKVDNCIIQITQKTEKQKHKKRLHLAISPLKNQNRFEFFIQKSCEIGINEITPIITDFSEKKKINMKRCNKIIISAIKQSNNYFKPKINDVISFNDFVKNNKKNTYICHCKKSEKKIKISDINSQEVNILIGPEGGFSEKEINFAIKNKIPEISVSKNILRTETAGIVCCSIIKS